MSYKCYSSAEKHTMEAWLVCVKGSRKRIFTNFS